MYSITKYLTNRKILREGFDEKNNPKKLFEVDLSGKKLQIVKVISATDLQIDP